MYVDLLTLCGFACIGRGKVSPALHDAVVPRRVLAVRTYDDDDETLGDAIARESREQKFVTLDISTSAHRFRGDFRRVRTRAVSIVFLFQRKSA